VIFGERDRRIIARLERGQAAGADPTNVRPEARRRLIELTRETEVRPRRSVPRRSKSTALKPSLTGAAGRRHHCDRASGGSGRSALGPAPSVAPTPAQCHEAALYTTLIAVGAASLDRALPSA
jgi:hypothetical protein